LIVTPHGNGIAKGEPSLDDGQSLVQEGVSEIELWWNGRELVMNRTFGYGVGGTEYPECDVFGGGGAEEGEIR
jgi:hypothetical protein